MRIVINKCYGGYGLSKLAYEYLNLEWDGFGYDFMNDRANPDLVRAVEVLGSEASGQSAKLEVVEIPGDVKWHIAEYDGMEHVAEDHRTWP